MLTFVLSSINVVTVRPSRFQRAPALATDKKNRGPSIRYLTIRWAIL